VKLSHLDDSGRARMVDVSAKPDTARLAVAEAVIRMRPETAALVRREGLPKGDVLAVSQLAGVLAAKQTPFLIPLCHSLLLTDVQVELDPGPDLVRIRASVRTVGKTGAEMEALTAAAVTALTVYDMCKAVDREMTIDGIRLVEKHGGKSDLAQEEA
jgi:cyclic pyranopterin phosphate synthase